MPTRTSYDHGTPSWIDIMTTSVEGAKAFYGGLFGWTAEDMDDGEGHYIYTNLRKDGKLVCGMGPQNEGMEGMPPVWATYINVDDAEQVAKSVEAAGGQVIVPVMQVMDEGTMAFFADPTGAAFGVWQPANHIGAEVINEANAYSWNELMTRDLDAAKRFYGEVFHWETDSMDIGDMGTYHVVRGGKDGIAGMMAMPPGMPDEVPNYWGVYFTVDSTDDTCARATELGGTILNGPMDSPVGRLATIQDPQGGTFSVMEAGPEQ